MPVAILPGHCIKQDLFANIAGCCVAIFSDESKVEMSFDNIGVHNSAKSDVACIGPFPYRLQPLLFYAGRS